MRYTKASELTVGRIYNNGHWLITYNGIIGNSIQSHNSIAFNTQSYYTGTGWGSENSFFSKNTVTDATPEEIAWMEACKAAGKYVDKPKSEIINEYQIF